MVVNARVMDDVLKLALIGIDGFVGNVSDKFGVEEARVVRLLQWPAEIVEGENVFEEPDP